jgi:hypothetical protein
MEGGTAQNHNFYNNKIPRYLTHFNLFLQLKALEILSILQQKLAEATLPRVVVAVGTLPMGR